MCAGAALLPAEMRTTNFIHFFEIARVAPINRQVCAITGKPRPARPAPATVGLQKPKEVVEHLATCSRFTPDLHFGAADALQGAGNGRQEQLDLARLGAGSTRGEQQRRGTCGIRQSYTLSSFPPAPAQLAVTFPLYFNRLLSVSLNAGKRVFYVPCKRESKRSRGAV